MEQKSFFDLRYHKDLLVEHYAEIAMIPGWLDYVRDRAREMKNDPRGVYAEIPDRIAARIKELKGG